MDYGRTLYLYFGTTLVHPLVEGRFSDLDQRVFSVDVSQCTSCLPNQTIVGRVWIVINSKTLESVNFRPFRCRVHYNRTFEDSSLAFIEVIYPECTFSPPQPNKLLVTSTYVPSATSTFVPLVTSTYVPPVTSTFVPLVRYLVLCATEAVSSL